MAHPNIEDEKEQMLVEIQTKRIDKMLLEMRLKRQAYPALAWEIGELETDLRSYRTDIVRIARERSERRKAEADTINDGIPYKQGGKSVDEIVEEREAHQSTRGFRAVTPADESLRAALVKNAEDKRIKR